MIIDNKTNSVQQGLSLAGTELGKKCADLEVLSHFILNTINVTLLNICLTKSGSIVCRGVSSVTSPWQHKKCVHTWDS